MREGEDTSQEGAQELGNVAQKLAAHSTHVNAP